MEWFEYRGLPPTPREAVIGWLYFHGWNVMCCTGCGRRRFQRHLTHRFTPDTPFTSERIEWLCRHCATPDDGFRSMEFFP